MTIHRHIGEVCVEKNLLPKVTRIAIDAAEGKRPDVSLTFSSCCGACATALIAPLSNLL